MEMHAGRTGLVFVLAVLAGGAMTPARVTANDAAGLQAASTAAAGGPAAAETTFPDVPLVTHDGRRVRFYSDVVRGRTVMINFMFTRCDDLCPTTTANLRRVQDLLGERLGKDVFMVSISIDPEHDTAAVLKRYAERSGARPGWDFLTGAVDDVELIRRRLGVFDREEDDDPTLHTGMLVYGNETKGLWRGVYVMAPPQQIVRGVARVQ